MAVGGWAGAQCWPLLHASSEVHRPCSTHTLGCCRIQCLQAIAAKQAQAEREAEAAARAAERGEPAAPRPSGSYEPPEWGGPAEGCVLARVWSWMLQVGWRAAWRPTCAARMHVSSSSCPAETAGAPYQGCSGGIRDSWRANPLR